MTGTDWYDRNGKPFPGTDNEIGSPAWVEAMGAVENLLTDPNYKVVKQDYTPHRHFWVSTVWLAIDHDFGRLNLDGPNPHPLIFETMVFRKRRTPPEWVVETLRGMWCKLRHSYHSVNDTPLQERYHTEAEAEAGHALVLAEYTAKERRWL